MSRAGFQDLPFHHHSGYGCAFSPSAYAQVCPYASEAPWVPISSCLEWRSWSLPSYLQGSRLGGAPRRKDFPSCCALYWMSNYPLWLTFCVYFSREYKTIMNFHLPKVARRQRVWWCVRTDCLLRRGKVVLVSLGPHGLSCQGFFTDPWDWLWTGTCLKPSWVCMYNDGFVECIPFPTS